MERISREELVQMYRPDVERMAIFIPWLEGKKGNDVTNMYDGDGQHRTMSIPVYDSIMLEFLNELGSSIFMNQNYRYIYTRYRMKDVKDEWNMIEKADIMTFDILIGILSKYTLGGLTKAYLWTQGMEYGIFYRALDKAKRIIEFYDVPIIIPTEEEEVVEEPLAEEAVALDGYEEGAVISFDLPAEAATEEAGTLDSLEESEVISFDLPGETTEETSAEEVVEETTEEVVLEEEIPTEEVVEEITEETSAEEVVEEATEEVVLEEEIPTEEVVEEITEETSAEEVVEEATEEVVLEEEVPTEEVVEEITEESSSEEVAEEAPVVDEETASLVEALDEVEKLLASETPSEE